MKKFLSLLLTVALVATSIVIPVTAATAGTAPTGAYYNAETGEYEADTNVVKEVYADVDFNDVSFDLRPYATLVEGTNDTYTVNVPTRTYMDYLITNKAPTDKTVRVQTSGNNFYSKDTVTFTESDLVTTSPKTTSKKASDLWYLITNYENEEGNKALTGGGAKNQAYFQFLLDEVDEENSTDTEKVYVPSGVAPETSLELIYVDFKMKRMATDSDGATMYLRSSDGKNIATINAGGNSHLQLVAGGASYGGGSGSGTNPTNYGFDTNWNCVRFVLNFNTKSFKLYVGDTWDTLKPFIDDVDSYTMQDTAATDFYKILAESKGTFGYDDISVYAVTAPVAPVATDITMTGKPNIGETLTCAYGAYSCEDGTLEGESYCYWESATNNSFLNAEKLTEDISVKAGDTSTYTITSDETGKYVRCVVVPVNASGVEGDKVYSNTNDFPINSTTYSIAIEGALKYGNFEWKTYIPDYKGKVTVNTTETAEKTVYLIAAWYETTTDAETGTVYPELVNVKVSPVTFSAAEAENGYVKEASYWTDAVYSVTEENKTASTSNLRMKVMLVDGMKSMNPLATVVTAGGSPEF